MFENIIRLLSEQLGVDPSEISEHSKLSGDLGADSLDIVDLLIAIEDRFGCSIPEEDVEDLVTVSDLVEYVENSM
ncbi:MAG: acyl carrier protein [Clostridia bacterium]|nr:acyl carrier protein [Clostridia bacterium]